MSEHSIIFTYGGNAGTSGTSGTSGGGSGTSGSGTSGTSGIDGASGTSGSSGTSGIDGTNKISGTPNSLTYLGTAGTSIETNASLITGKLDPQGRSQIWDYRTGGAGPVYRQGAWESDGDPVSVEGDGIVIYGVNSNGIFNVSEGAYARVKKDRFGIGQIILGVNGGNFFYNFRVDRTAMAFRDLLNNLVANIGITSGEAFFNTLRIGSMTGPRIITYSGSPEGAVTGSVGDICLNTNGAGTLWTKESGSGNTGWTLIEAAVSGTSGTSGISGTSGLDGTSGTSGISGTSGTSGTGGATGTFGAADGKIITVLDGIITDISA